MEIQGPGGISGPNRLEPHHVPEASHDPTSELSHISDRVEISEQARLLEQLSQVPTVRIEKVEELRRLIESGEYETPEKIEVAVTKLMDELG